MTGAHRLADLARVLRGRAPAHTVAEPDGAKFFGIAEVTARGHGTPRYLEHDANVEGPTLAEGDVVVALLGNVGDAALVDASNAGAVLARECAALRVIAHDAVRPAWLGAWTGSQEFRTQVARNLGGTTMPRLPVRALEDFTITVPPLQKQHDIEGLVRRFDAAIATTATTLNQLQDLRAAELQLALATSEDTL